MFNKVLFIGRKNCKYSKKLEVYLKKKTKYLKVIYSNKKNTNLKTKAYEYVFCFRSHIILKNNFINKIQNSVINFHPGPPNYRGIGCVNYALFDGVKTYGSTCHLIENENIDEGKILNLKKFKIKKNDDLEAVLNLTYKNMLIQAKKIIDHLCKNKTNLNILIKKNNHLKWSNKIKKLHDLNKFYEIDLKYNKKKFHKKIRATNTKNFKPYIIFHGKKFLYDE